ncbi:hypothetical protein BMS3Abin17_00581 [archaeon BMS3Abin17]|nr:hypothetical protein BMS3Abin17_00581 [archaeon BMS3Abin17]
MTLTEPQLTLILELNCFVLVYACISKKPGVYIFFDDWGFSKNHKTLGEVPTTFK